MSLLRWLRVWGVLAALLTACVCGGSMRAQQTGTAASANLGVSASGTVTGTVMFGDTQHSARFVEVTLQAVPSASGSAPGGGRGLGGFGGGGSARTGLDGMFAMSNVAPGDYWVLASAPGYIAERAQLQSEFDAGVKVEDLAAQIPTVHIGADGGGSVIVTLQRGGAIAGHLQWEDGSPAAGVEVYITPSATQQLLPQPLSSIRGSGATTAMTDDRGAFRIMGLPGGDYVVEAIVSVPNQFGGGRGGAAGTPIRVYVPGVFRKGDAKPIAVRVGDERDDLQLVIDLSGLHTVSGHVSSATAGLNVVSGRVSLADTTDTSLQMTAPINGEGDFSISYVPNGSYTLTVQGSTHADSGGLRGRSSSGVTFQPYSQPLTVTDTDVTGLGINLTPAQGSQ